MIRDADGPLKDRLGRAAYIWTGARNIRSHRVDTRIRVDGQKWFDGKASCVLVGNVGKIMGDVAAFPDSKPDDGHLEIGVVTAQGAWQWSRTLARTVTGSAERSPFVKVTAGKRFDVRFSKKTTYELDGGDRKPVARLKIKVKPAAITVCLPVPSVPPSPAS